MTNHEGKIDTKRASIQPEPPRPNSTLQQTLMVLVQNMVHLSFIEEKENTKSTSVINNQDLKLCENGVKSYDIKSTS
jgi:hypothetical protein